MLYHTLWHFALCFYIKYYIHDICIILYYYSLLWEIQLLHNLNISYGVKVILLEISKWEIFFGINLFI